MISESLKGKALRISITFERTTDLSPAVRRGIEQVILTSTEAQTAVWIAGRLTYRTDRTEEEVIADWELHGFSSSDFASVSTGPWVDRRRNRKWTARERRIR
ncbi:hypothetical protein [Paracoccus laeviglucosivorans]|uniref:Uncharacterized protein n=1 Tax=Paracoccus laeviglucosivorans TaxID=1197861 RepID=A0A521F093_9RHOB|nr:hypothetical protein [Paracoccus laeviglucosivorans]SMO89575.1 hypothetical protein SAMN06265221_11733 [Paracoccus laeviglucosivorans]